MPYITVVPAVRTIPGVEEFDYAVDDGSGLQLGDLICVTFRKRPIPALITKLSSTSAFASRAVHLGKPDALLRLGAPVTTLLERTALRTLSSKPSALFSWIRHVPKRAPSNLVPRQRRQTGLPQRETRYLADRWTAKNGLLETAKAATGATLILTPWQHRADALGKILGCPVLHADLAMGQAWKTIREFVDGSQPLLVTTRLGAWLASQAQCVLVDEPENDDFKQDELAPRFDARWIVDHCAELQPDLSVLLFATTPRIDTAADQWKHAPDIAIQMRAEPKLLRGMSAIRDLSEQTASDIEEALQANKPVTIIHPIKGEQARITCRDCGWTAACVACGFSVSLVNGHAVCRRCGRKNEIPAVCPSCGGSDLSRGRTGANRLAQQLASRFPGASIPVLDAFQMHQVTLPEDGLVVITDISLIGGVSEDIRRRERLLIAWRRLAASLAFRKTSVVVQGPEETLTDCTDWLTADGVARTWNKEIEERATFGYPPATRLIKIIIDGSEDDAVTVYSDLEKRLPANLKLRGPFGVPYRSASRGERFILHLTAPKTTDDATLVGLLDGFNKRAIIDLDPIAFFS